MTVSFDNLQVGKEYERPFLADLWGYRSYQAISRGVVTPSGTNFIILFVTKNKQQALTQYNDYIDGGVLHWEGEQKHTSDARIVDAHKNGDSIHLFYRDVHHSPFVYFGRVFLEKHQINRSVPSTFIFSMEMEGRYNDPIDDIESHKREYSLLDSTERESIIKSRIGQGIFRERLIKFWGSCSVTGLSNLSLLRASHIKPWRNCSNQERLDPMNGLLLHPTFDQLFDTGLVTFESNGKTRISNRLSVDDVRILHVDPDVQLRKFPRQTGEYMEFHRENVFKNN